VQQTSGNNTVAYGFVYSQTASAIKVTQVKGSFVVGLSVTGVTSGTSRTLVASTNPEFEPYCGDILYVENVQKIDRADGQAENIRFIIQF